MPASRRTRRGQSFCGSEVRTAALSSWLGAGGSVILRTANERRLAGEHRGHGKQRRRRCLVGRDPPRPRLEVLPVQHGHLRRPPDGTAEGRREEAAEVVAVVPRQAGIPVHAASAVFDSHHLGRRVGRDGEESPAVPARRVRDEGRRERAGPGARAEGGSHGDGAGRASRRLLPCRAGGGLLVIVDVVGSVPRSSLGHLHGDLVFRSPIEVVAGL